jgi:Protein of unknown function (DUF2934)
MSAYQSIAELAYKLWDARGRPQGTEKEDWLEAERQLAAPASETSIDSSLKETFPASDPPASHIPDVPPANASEKWAAAGVARKTRSKPTPKSTTTKNRGKST